MADINTTEIDSETKHPVIDMLEEQKSIDKMGGSQGLGEYPAEIKKGTIVYSLYSRGKDFSGPVGKGHRHGLEVNFL